MKRRLTTLFCCFAACLVLLSGCISVIDAAPHSSSKTSKTDNVNLLVKIDVEKNGVLLDSISAIASKDNVTLSDGCQSKPENGAEITRLNFTGSNIRKVAEDSYSMDYKTGLIIPLAANTSGPTGRNSVQYTDVGSSSSINVKSGQPVCIYENNVYKVKLTVTAQK